MAMRYMPKEGGHKVVMVAHEHGGYVLYSEHRAEVDALKAENERLRESHARLAAAMREIVDEEPCDPSGRPSGYCLTHDSRTPCSMIEARAALADALKLE
jgi:hypothetical protein